MPYKVSTCLDPFAGSGTTAVTSRFLGVSSISIEVNPFLADLLRAKIARVSPSLLSTSYERVVKNLRVKRSDAAIAQAMPPTFREPGVNGRYIFPADVFDTAQAMLRRIQSLENKLASRTLKVLLGSVLIACSNVIVNGKGRRYRRNWTDRQKTPFDLIAEMDDAVDTAVADLVGYAGLPAGRHRVYCADARNALRNIASADLAIFSPPYPNSFDYTDVYNVELWMLGYLQSPSENLRLRRRTLSSHVQVKWNRAIPNITSPSLHSALARLGSRRNRLWDHAIPSMLALYFQDLANVFLELHRILAQARRVIVVVGDSQYAGVRIGASDILMEIVCPLGFTVLQSDVIRSMRTSSQHGGHFDLCEYCMVFERI